jgi:hypothetical protein
MLGDWEAAGFAATGATVRILGIDQWTFEGGLLARSDQLRKPLRWARTIASARFLAPSLRYSVRR